MWMTADLLRSLAAQGERAALIQVQGDSAQATSSAELAGLATRLAHGLVAQGIKPGDPVGLVGPNGLDWIVVRLALAGAGALTVACDDLGNPEDIAGFLHDSGCKLAFVTAAHAEHLKKSGASYGMRLLDGGDSADGWRAWMVDPAGELPPVELPKQSPDAETMVVYTSGTTGKPKSFALTHANLAANVEALLAEKIATPADRVLLPLPLHHVFPLLVGLLTTLGSGAALVLPEAVAGPQIATALRVAKATVMVGVPRLFTALLAGIEAKVETSGGLAAFAYRKMLNLSLFAQQKFDWNIGKTLFGALHKQLGGHLRLMASGGAKLEGAAVWRLEALGFQVLSGYGLAETASMFTANLPSRQRIGSEGRPIGDGQVRVAKILDGDADAPDMGEIQLKGASVFAGYRDNPEANATAFTEDGWFRTGDLGHVDVDGYVFITGRAKEMIVLGGGKNVYPEETEKHYADSPYIREVAVLEKDGKLVALVLPDPVAIRAAGLTRLEDAIRVTLSEKSQTLPSYQRVAGYALIREPLPRTRLGKYRRFLLPKLYDEAKSGLAKPKSTAMSAEDQALVNVSPTREAWELLRARYADRGITLDANMSLDLGIDSLEWMTLALEIESRLGVQMREADLQDVNTVRDLLAVLAKAKPATGIAGETPADVAAAAEHWLAPTGPALSLLGWTLYWVNRLGLKLMFRISATGMDNVPMDGPVMIVANHVSDIDPPVVAGVLPYKRMRKLFWSGDVGRLFENALGKGFARATHIFPVDERSPKATLTMGKEVLARGNGLVWFPEAWRSPDGELQRFLPGAGLVLSAQPVTVVPAYIDGAYEALPRHRHSLKFVKVTVHFGPAVPAEEIRKLAAEGGNEGAQRIVAFLQDRVAALKP